MRLLEGRRAIVTGGASGIGKAVVERFASDGASVAILDIDVQKAEVVQRQVQERGGRAMALQVDVTDLVRMEQAVDEVAEHFGGLDIVCNNAADLSLLNRDLDLLNSSPDVWDATWAADLRSVMAMTKFALPYLLNSSHAAIVNVSSVDGTSGDNTRFAYCTAKAGINVLTQCIATTYGKLGVRCNAVLPGLVLSASAEENLNAMPALRTVFEENVVTPHLGAPAEVASVISFLASDNATYINGELIRVDGGLMSHVPHFAQAKSFFDSLANGPSA